MRTLCRSSGVFTVGLGAMALAFAGCDGSRSVTAPGTGSGGSGVSDGALPLGPVCGLSLTRTAFFQSVEIPVMDAGHTVAVRKDVVAGKAALVRAFVSLIPGWVPATEVAARLTLAGSTGTFTHDANQLLSLTSAERDVTSTLDFDVPAAELDESTGFAIEVTSVNGCATTSAPLLRFPAQGTTPLNARFTGILHVQVVPIQYHTDGSDRLPVVSQAQLDKYTAILRAMYPAQDVQLSVRPSPVSTSITVSPNDGWSTLLDALRAVRAKDGAPDNVYYFGLVSPGASLASYCGTSCIVGLSYQVPPNTPSLRVGLGIGYESNTAVVTMAHELGHQHGMGHAPCDTTAGLDKNFPYPDGSIGVWGYDTRFKALRDPTQYSDIMGYCSPAWISDYTYQALLERSVAVNLAPAASVLTRGGAASAIPATTWLTALIDGNGQAGWGLPVSVAQPFGMRENADVLDEAGRLVATISVFRTWLSDAVESSVLVPPPQTGWASLRMSGAKPLPFSQPSVGMPLEDLSPSRR